MSNQPADIGVKALWDNQEFIKGNQEYIKRLLDGNKATSQASGLMSKLGSVAGINLSGGLLIALGAVAALAAGFVALIAGGVKVVKSLAEIAVEAAPLEGIGNAFEAMAGKFNVSLDAMRAASGGTISDFELMRQANIALTGAGGEFGQMFGQALPTLLEGARRAAQATGQSVDFLFNSLVTGVKRGSPLLIDNTGLVISQTEAQAKLAEQLGVTTAQLTKEQKQIALLNATTDAINAATAEFGEIQLTAADQIARVSAETSNIKDALGLALQPALKTITGAWADMLAGMAEGIRTGGALQDIIVKLGATASIVADGIAAGIKVVGEVVNWIADKFDTGLTDVVQNAFDWGINIITALADGMIQAIGSVLTWAMNALSAALGGWLSPGSPPKVAPDLDKWGMSAVGEWLKGMTEADFGVLNDIQGPLQSALNYLESTGGLGEGQAGSLFADISKDLIEGLAGGDASAAIERIRNQAGEFGDEIADLAEAQLELAAANDAVTQSEQRLEAARQGADDATAEALAATKEYNDLLREGASPEILAGQMAQIDAAELAEQAALAEVSAAEEALATAQEREEQAASAVETQQAALDEMMQLQAALTGAAPPEAPAGAAGAGAGAGGGALGGMGATLSAGMDGITTMMEEKVAEMKQKMLEKLGGIWEGLKEKWASAWGPVWTEMSTAWETLTTTLKQFYDEKIAPMWEDFTFWLDENVSPAVDGLIEVATELGEYIEAGLTGIVTILGEELAKLWQWFYDIWDTLEINLTPMLEYLRDDLIESVRSVVDDINEALATFANWLQTIASRIRNMPRWTDATEESPAPLAAGLHSINEEMTRMSQKLPTLHTQLKGISSPVPGGVAPVTTSTTQNIANINMNNNFSGDIGLAQLRAVVRDVIRTEMRP